MNIKSRTDEILCCYEDEQGSTLQFMMDFAMAKSTKKRSSLLEKYVSKVIADLDGSYEMSKGDIDGNIR